MRRVLALAAVGLASSGCAVAVEGDFDGIVFAPGRSVQAILDSHTILERRGALVPVERARSNMTVDLWLSGATVPENNAWRELPSDRLLDVRKDLATHDLLVLRGIDFDSMQDDTRVLTATTNDADAASGIARGSGDFDFFVGQPVPDGFVDDGLAGRITVELSDNVIVRDEPRGGRLETTMIVTRERAAGQPSTDLAGGAVTLRVAVTLAPERLAEANLAIVDPIARCVAERGPDAGAACARVPADPVVDAHGSL
jgi:hypothetical protein